MSKKCVIRNKFGLGSRVRVKWCHSNLPSSCGSIPVDDSEETPEIGGSSGHLTIQALGPDGKSGIESKITLKPPYPSDHNILFSYDTSSTSSKYEWKVEAEKNGTEYGLDDTWQINVNVEIGPKT